MDDRQSSNPASGSRQPQPPSPSWFIYADGISRSFHGAKQDTDNGANPPDSRSQHFWEAKSTGSSVAGLRTPEDQAMSSPVPSLVSFSHDINMNFTPSIRSASHDTQNSLAPSLSMRSQSPQTPHASPASFASTIRPDPDFFTNPALRQPSSSGESPDSWDNSSSPHVHALWSPVNEQTKNLLSYRGPYETTHRFWLVSDASSWTWTETETDYNSSTETPGGSPPSTQPSRYNPGPNFRMPAVPQPQRQFSEQDVIPPKYARPAPGPAPAPAAVPDPEPWQQSYLTIPPGQPIDVPAFLKSNCLEATKEYLFRQRQQWLRLFRPNHHDWEEASHNSPRSSLQRVRYIIGGQTITGRHNAWIYVPYLYYPKPSDSFAYPPPEPPVGTDSLRDNIAAINELAWKRMVHRTPTVDPGVMSGIHVLSVGACRVGFTHPDITRWFSDSQSGGVRYVERFTEAAGKQLEAAIWMCQRLGATERAMAVCEVACRLQFTEVGDEYCQLLYNYWEGDHTGPAEVLKQKVWDGRNIFPMHHRWC